MSLSQHALRKDVIRGKTGVSVSIKKFLDAEIL